MFNKDNLKKLNKAHYLVVTTLASVLVAATVAGCGAKADMGETEVATEAVESENLVETDVGETEEPVEEPDVEPDVMTFDERNETWEKPIDEDAKMDFREYYKSNKFFLIKTVESEPEGGYPEGTKSKCYVKTTGTLYELYFYGEPDNDYIYFPGDELPEGYEVKVTEDCVVMMGDSIGFGEDGENIFGVTYLVKEDTFGQMSYRRYFSGCFSDSDLDPSIPPSQSYSRYPAVEPGMYGDLTEYYLGEKNVDFVQYLTKKDLDALPEGVTLADNVVHE